MAEDILKKFENFDSDPQNRGRFLDDITTTIRTTDVPQSLKELVNDYDERFGPVPSFYAGNAQNAYLNAIRREVTRLTSPPVQGSGKRKKTRRTRRRSTRRRH